MINVVQVRKREAGRVQSFKLGDIILDVGDYCVFETDRGNEYGQVVGEPVKIMGDDAEVPKKSIVRKVNTADEEVISRNKRDAKRAAQTCMERIESHKLQMKLVYVEYSFDRHKMIFYFTAEGRIDFRELVKDLAGLFKVRIELRQIGVRDEAKILGGVGCCGRELCCAKFLKDFEPVNIKMAKLQRLPLNPDKISGVCGRLLCCLKYEYDTYKKYLKKLPHEGTVVITEHGEGFIKDLNILKSTVLVDLGENREILLPIDKIKIK